MWKVSTIVRLFLELEVYILLLTTELTLSILFFSFYYLFNIVPAKINLPKHLEGMGAVHALRGEVVSIKIPFTGKPDPVITWQKGQDLIDNNGQYQVIVTRSFTSLVFSNGVDRKDAGFYVVCAKNRFGIDQKTVELDVADVPDPPRGLKVSDVSRDSVNLTWSEPATDGGSKITNYIIEKCATTAERWLRVAQSRETRYTVVNLFGKTRYQFRVIAENKFGQSKPSEPTDPVLTKEDKTRMLNYDDEVSEIEISTKKATHSSTKVLHERYSIAEELGHGQFGIAHRCIENSSKKTFLAKFVKVKGTDQVAVKKEISILNIARHKNILYLYESFDSLEELVMIFEFISGVDIFERLSTSGFDLSEREAVSYVRQICEALDFLHSNSVANFDIRPESIIYTTRRSSSIKITEFGQARQLVPGDSFRIQFTAPEYYAPEVHQHDLVSTATDMWSLGTLVYILLSGINPFAAETNQQVIENIINAEYNFEDEAFKDISLEAMDFIDRLLVKERKSRMTAAEALEHSWLKQKTEKISTKVIKTLRHRRYYQSLIKKEWSFVVSVARISCGGAIRSQKGVTVAKVKVASIEIGPLAGQITHSVGEEGGYAKFSCKIENYDQSTQVTWYFGIRQLENNDKYEITYSEGVATMYVKDIRKSDDGTYRCKVVNDYGEDSSYGELFVSGVREQYEYYRCRTVKKVKRRIDAMRLLERPPEFTLPLFNRTAYIGENIRFGVTITVHPDPQVTWLKSGQKIKPGEDDKKYTFETDKGLYQLIIHNLTTDDDAEYTVMAKNRYGEDSCKAKLTVIPHPAAADNTLRPMFKRLLANAECHEGQSVRFEIRVSGTPKPTLAWEKDGQTLALGPNIEIIHEGLDYFALLIRDTLPEDTGYYRVTATNSAGSTSCQAYLKVERMRYVKREYKSEEDRKVQVQKQIDKTLRMAEILAGTDSVPLTPIAQQALREAAILYKPAVSTKTVKGEYEITKEEKKEIKTIRMPYEIPPPRVHTISALEEDQSIKKFVPMSDMKWYKKLRDQYEMPEPLERIVQKRPKRIRLSRWEQFYVMPLPRITDQYKPKWRIPKLSQDDLETVRPARRRTPSPDYEVYYRPRRRSLGDVSDDELLLSVDDYLAMKRVEEERLRLEEELVLGFSASPPSRSPPRFELSTLRYASPEAHVSRQKRSEAEARYASYHVPVKEEVTTSYADLRERYDRAVYKPPRQKQRVFEEREDEELLRPYSTTQRLSQYTRDLEYMAKEEKSRSLARREREITRITDVEEAEEAFTSRTSRQVRQTSPEVTRLLGRRRSLSPTYIELMRPVSELIRPRSKPAEPERRSPTPERTRPRSPSPVSSERSLSRFERTARFDIFSRYESMKAALKTQKTSERKYEVLTQQPFTLDNAPRITLRMRSHRVPIGQNTRFILNVQSKPTGEIQWYHNSIEIHESSKYHISNVSGVLTIEIIDCQPEDSGTYRAVCTNYKGEASDYATLDVSGGDYTTYTPKRKDDAVPRSAFPDLLKSEDYAVSSFKKTSEIEASSQRREVRSQITSSRETKESYEAYASEEKRVSASEARALEERVVQRKFKTSEPAKILTKPQSVTVSEGEHVRFSCDFDGEPTPTVTWLLAGKSIVSSVRHHISSTKYRSSFEITSVKLSDEGSYTVVVENSEGKQEAHFTLTIKRSKAVEKGVTSPTRVKSPEPHKKSHESIKSPRRVKSPEPATPKKSAAKSPADKVQLPAVTAPKIAKNLKAVASHDTAKLSCAVESTLLNGREVSWFKDGKKLREDGHFSFYYSSDGTYELNIHSITEADQGEYVCEIVGEGGVSRTNLQFVGQTFRSVFAQVSSVMESIKSVQKTTSLSKAAVHEEVTKTDVVSEEIKTIHSESKSSISFSEGQKVTLKANIPGASNAKWVLNGYELKNSEDYRYGVSGSDQTITIKKVSSKDQGILTCEARTDQGIVKCQFDLTLSKDLSNAPLFVYQPKSQNVNEGQNVIFTCEITGDPTPEVEWFKDNVLVSNFFLLS